MKCYRKHIPHNQDVLNVSKLHHISAIIILYNFEIQPYKNTQEISSFMIIHSIKQG